jgi:NAD(P)H-flavin reductase
MLQANPYVPLPVRVSEVVFETEHRTIKTLRFEFLAARFTFACGQFAEVLVPGKGEAPFGMASSPMKDSLEFTVSRVGSVTSAIHDLEVGDHVGVRGPLGNGFPMKDLEGKDLVLIGGGFGFTTLRSLTNYVLHPVNRQHFGRMTVIYGARTPGMMLYKAELEQWGKRSDIDLRLTIDRAVAGWGQLVGFVPAVTEQVRPSAGNAMALVCGPPVMIKFTLPVLRKLGFAPEQVLLSLEMKMKCGIGQCGRCNIGNKYVCKDGPVFSLAELASLPDEF